MDRSKSEVGEPRARAKRPLDRDRGQVRFVDFGIPVRSLAQRAQDQRQVIALSLGAVESRNCHVRLWLGEPVRKGGWRIRQRPAPVSGASTIESGVEKHRTFGVTLNDSHLPVACMNRLPRWDTRADRSTPVTRQSTRLGRRGASPVPLPISMITPPTGPGAFRRKRHAQAPNWRFNRMQRPREISEPFAHAVQDAPTCPVRAWSSGLIRCSFGSGDALLLQSQLRQAPEVMQGQGSV
jgi:hypothetical protein